MNSQPDVRLRPNMDTTPSHRRPPFLLLTVIGLTLGVTTWADNWPTYRGPMLNGTTAESGWQAEQSKYRIAWKENVGIGASSVVVVGNQVIAMGNRDNQDIVVCLNADDGMALWRFTYPCEFEKRMFEGGTAATPCVDGDRVYILAHDGQLHCLNLKDGKARWKKHLIQDYNGAYSQWKYSCTPLVEGNLLILDNGGNGNSTLALDKLTGKKVWGQGNDQAGYASPMPFDQGKTRGVMVFKGEALVAYDVKNGRELWRIPWKTSYDVNASTPLVMGKQFFLSAGYRTGRGALFQLTDKTPKKLWENDRMRTKMSTCAAHRAHIFGISEKGQKLMCLRMSDGQIVWDKSGFSGTGSLIIADGKLIILSEGGELTIADASSGGYKQRSRGQVLSGRTWVTPVLANGRIYCKNNAGDLVCIDVRK